MSRREALREALATVEEAAAQLRAELDGGSMDERQLNFALVELRLGAASVEGAIRMAERAPPELPPLPPRRRFWWEDDEKEPTPAVRAP